MCCGLEPACSKTTIRSTPRWRKSNSAVARLHSKALQEGLDSAPVDDLAGAVGTLEELTERFKSDNALLRNSLSYVGLLSTNPDFVERNPLIGPSIGALAAAILQLTVDTSPQSSQAVQNRLVELTDQTPVEESNSTPGNDGDAAATAIWSKPVWRVTRAGALVHCQTAASNAPLNGLRGVS